MEPQEENFQPQITSPPRVETNRGQAQGENGAQDAQQTQDAQDQPSTSPNGKERNLTQRVSTQQISPTNGQNNAPDAWYTMRE